MDIRLKKIIDIIHNLQEEGVIANVVSGGQIAGTAEAGDDPPVRKKKKRGKKYMSGGRGSRKMWLDFLRNK